MDGPGDIRQHRADVGEPTAVVEDQIAQWERHRAMGRTGFILRRGVLSLGIPIAFLTIFYKIVQEQGFVRTPQLTSSLRSAIVVAIVVFPLCGWLFGRWLWDSGEARYRALTRTRD